MGFQKVAEVQEFERIEKKLVELEDKKILLTKVDNAYYAISNKPKILFWEFKMENEPSYSVKVQDGEILIDINGE